MPLLLPIAFSLVLASFLQGCDEECRCSSCSQRFGFDPSGKRGPAIWDNPRRGPDSLEEEALEGHIFASVAPPG